MQRIERYFVPEDALREALLNALCHKNINPASPSRSVFTLISYILQIAAVYLKTGR